MFSLIKTISLFFLFLASFFLGLVGLLFNWTVYITVFQFGNLIGNNDGMLKAWGVLRDIGNILLLFGFIFMGVSTILNLPGNEFTAKRALPALIIFAILMNFSLFAAEAVIDTSNALGSTFYRQAGNGLCPQGASAKECATNYGVSGTVMQLSGITSIFSFSWDKPDNIIPGNDGAAAIAVIGLTLFAAVTAMVLLAAVFMLITRAVVLAFLMVLSPVGFAGMAVPPLHGLAKQWWDQLLKQAFFAPVYLLLVLVSLKFMDGIRTALGGDANVSLAAAFSAAGISNLSMVVMFVLMIGLMLAATEMAKRMSAVGAGAATKMAGATVFGGMARVSNFGVGGGFRLMRYGVQQTARRANPETRFGKAVRSVGSSWSSALKKGERINTDLRAFPGMGAVQGLAGGPAEHATYDDVQHQVQQIREGMRQDRAEFEQDTNMQRLRKELVDGKLSPDSERFLGTLSGEEIAADHDLQHLITELAPVMSTSQFEGLIRSKDTTQRLKDEAREARFKEFMEEAVLKSDKRLIRRQSAKDLEQFFAAPAYAELLSTDEGRYQLQEMVTLMNQSTYDTLRASTVLTNSQRAAIKQWRDGNGMDRDGTLNPERNGRFDTTLAFSFDGKQKPLYLTVEGKITEDETKAAKNDKGELVRALRIDRTIQDLNINDRTSLEDSILGRKEVYERFQPGDFGAMQRKDKLEDHQRPEVGAYIDKMLNTAGPKGDAFRAYRDSLGEGDWRKMKAFYALKSEQNRSKK